MVRRRGRGGEWYAAEEVPDEDYEHALGGGGVGIEALERAGGAVGG